MTPDLEQLSTSTILEDFAQHRRYEAQLRKSLGHRAYEARDNVLRAVLKARGQQIEERTAVVTRPVCRLRPLSDHVVILPDEGESISPGGIIKPDTAKEKPMQGDVLAVGPGRIEPSIGTVLPSVSVGDVVLFGRYSGTEVVLDDLRVLIMREEDVLGVLMPKAEG